VSETGVGNGSGSATVEGYLSPSSGLECESLSEKLPGLHPDLLALIESCLRLEPAERATAAELLEHPFFRGFASRFMPKLGEALRRDAAHYQAPSQGPSAYAEEGARSGVIIGGRTSQSSLVSPEMGRPVPLGANGAVWPTSDEYTTRQGLGNSRSGSYAEPEGEMEAHVLPAVGVLMTHSVVDDEAGAAPWNEDTRSRRGSDVAMLRSHGEEGIGLALAPPGAVSEADSVRSDFSRISYLTQGTVMT